VVAIAGGWRRNFRRWLRKREAELLGQRIEGAGGTFDPRDVDLLGLIQFSRRGTGSAGVDDSKGCDWRWKAAGAMIIAH